MLVIGPVFSAIIRNQKGIPGIHLNAVKLNLCCPFEELWQTAALGQVIRLY